MNFIKEIYHGDVPLAPNTYNINSKYAKLINSLDILTTDLQKTLPAEYANQINILCDVYGELLSISSEENYVSGFRDGAKTIIDVFTGKNDNLNQESLDTI